MWGWLLAAFVGVWLLQFLLTRIQVQNYQTTLKQMSKRPSGYLGVGVIKQKLGIGVLAIMVVNENNEVVESQVMKGVTVFSRFEPFEQFDGLTLNEVKARLGEEPVDAAFKMAIDKIEAQREKKLAV